jgi:hypothetical protein
MFKLNEINAAGVTNSANGRKTEPLEKGESSDSGIDNLKKEDKLYLSEDYYKSFQSVKKTDVELDSKIDNKKTEKDKKFEDDEKKIIEDLKKRDEEVRAHEAAHKNAAGKYAKGGAQFNYTVGPDGKQYAIGGEVKIDMSPIPGDPVATIEKMQTLQRAALSPEDPSNQDAKAAASASKMIEDAKAELSDEKKIDKHDKDGAINAYIKNSKVSVTRGSALLNKY